MRVKFFAQEHNIMSPARALDPEASALTMKPPRLPTLGKVIDDSYLIELIRPLADVQFQEGSWQCEYLNKE